MKARTLISTAVVATVMGGSISSCGADPVSIVSILLITNTWAEVGNINHEFDMDADPTITAPTDHGVFTGVETTANGQTFDLTGNWSNGHVTWTVQRPNGQHATYSGTFVGSNPDTLRLDSAQEGPLVIFR